MPESTPKPDSNAPTKKPTEAASETPVAAKLPTSNIPEPSAPKPQSRKKLIIIAFVVLVLLLGGAGAYAKYGRKPVAVDPSPSATPSVEPTSSLAGTILEKFSKPTTGETWLSTPEKLSQQNFLREGLSEDATYYKVGQRGEATIIMSVVSQVGDMISLYEKTADGKVSAIIHPDSEATYNVDDDKNLSEWFSAKVKLNAAIHYDSLTMPRELSIDKDYTLKKPTSPNLGNFKRADSSGTTQTAVLSYGSSKIMRNETKYADTKLTSIGYTWDTPIHTSVTLAFVPLELNLSEYQWEKGNSTTDTISPITRGCGGALTAATRGDAVTVSDVQTVGKSSAGVQVYEFKSLDNPLVTKAYQEFIDFYKDTPDSTPYYNISKEQFVKEHSLVVFQDRYGQWLIYTRDQLRPQGGCAKPVVYLYPQRSQPVSVRVGANVKISEPHYDPKTGWNVWATPSGTLMIGNTSYNSLFWEGPGIGAYPGVTTGTVVTHDTAAATIREQLTAQGLNGQESTDFMAYWESKIPSKPYVRLTWFNTAQMNELAPLIISPRPDTLIRVFLDMDGLDTPIDLPAQKLEALPRTGFTAVEWGGLSNFQLK